MKSRIVLIDGYNVIHRGASLRRELDRGLAPAREALIRLCRERRSREGGGVEYRIVFDGKSAVVGDRAGCLAGTSVVFTRDGQTADEAILACLRESKPEIAWVVVSDDREVTGNAKAHGADIMSAGEFCGGGVRRPKGAGARTARGEKPGMSPVEEKEINDALRKEWGLS